MYNNAVISKKLGFIIFDVFINSKLIFKLNNMFFDVFKAKEIIRGNFRRDIKNKIV